MQVFNMVLYTAIVLGGLIFIHELGHFLAAKLTGMRVDRFSIGFPPRAFGRKIGDTDYCISWIPLGGYVKIAGMVDESMDTEFLNREPQPWEFRARPMWARMIVISAGVIMNVLLALGIFWGIQYSRGKVTMETTEIGYVMEKGVAQQAGLQAGDKIVSINGKQVGHWEEIQTLMYIDNIGNDLLFDVERQGRHELITILRKDVPQLSDSSDEQFGIMPAHTVAVIDGIEPGMPAEKAGLKAADTLVALNSIPVKTSQQVVAYIRSHPGQSLKVEWKRGAEVQSGTTTISNEGRIGIRIGGRYLGPIKNIQYTLLEAFPRAVAEIGQSIYLHYLTVSKLISGKTTFKESLGGPIKIAQFASQSAEFGLASFLWFMAQLSMSLAILNILPIPALDGGHLIMLIYEKIFRREIPNKIKIAIQQVGFILLLAFMAFVIYNDIAHF